MARFSRKAASGEDPRWQRSRAALIDAALALASEHPIQDVTVREVTKRAGVDRTTFYNHAESPQQLVSEVLGVEFDELYQQFRDELERGDFTPEEAQRHGIRSLLEHVIHYQAIYRLTINAVSGGVLQSVIGEHVRAAAREMLDEGLYPFEPPIAPTEFQKDFAAQAMSLAMLGGIAAWIRQDSPPDIDEFMESFSLFFPDWFTMAGSARPADTA